MKEIVNITGQSGGIFIFSWLKTAIFGLGINLIFLIIIIWRMNFASATSWLLLIIALALFLIVFPYLYIRVGLRLAIQKVLHLIIGKSQRTFLELFLNWFLAQKKPINPWQDKTQINSPAQQKDKRLTYIFRYVLSRSSIFSVLDNISKETAFTMENKEIILERLLEESASFMPGFISSTKQRWFYILLAINIVCVWLLY